MNKLIISQFGKAADVLEIITAPAAAPLCNGEVRVKLLAAPINPADLNWIAGTYGSVPELPATPGVEGVAEVIESQSEKFTIGQRVIFLKHAASWQSERIAREDELLAVPHDADLFQLAMLKVNPATAWCLLKNFRALHRGDFIVQNASNSGVGTCVIQLAHALGIRSINFVRKMELAAELKSHGADYVFPDTEEGMNAALEILGGANAKLACNAVGGESALRLLNLLEKQAAHITYGAMSRRPVTVPNKFLIFREIDVRGLWVTQWLARADAAEISHAYQSLITLIREGKMKQRVDRIYPLQEFSAALEKLNSATRNGKILFRMSHCE